MHDLQGVHAHALRTHGARTRRAHARCAHPERTHGARRYDYRLCYRQSATERLRSLQAISWSWRPYSCALAPVRGEAFDRCGCPPAATPGSPTCPARNPAHTRAPRWLGPRHLLLLGDSLMAQLYYSLVWLLGDSLLEQHDLFGYATGESTVGSTRLGACASRLHTARPRHLHGQAGTGQSRPKSACLAWGAGVNTRLCCASRHAPKDAAWAPC